MYNQLITKIQEIVYYIQIQNYHKSGMKFRELLQTMQQDIKLFELMKDKNSILYLVVEQMLQTLETEDMILLADILSESLIPLLKNLLEYPKEKKFEKYCLETTSCGYYTLKDIVYGRYLHSNINPMEEARVLIERCYDSKKEQYAVWGLGLGYHVLRLYEKSRGAIEIEVFEEDETILSIAHEYGVLESIPEQKIVIHHDPTGQKFANYIAKENVGLLLHLPSIKKIQDIYLKNIMQQFFMSWNGTIQYKTELEINYRSNRNRLCKNVDEIKNEFIGKKVVLVAAGPSLDEKLQYLKEECCDKIIVVVTTVLKKLLDIGIVPDYTVVMDSQKRTIKQIEGVEEAKVPMIIDSTAYWEFADRYRGEKYLVYQKGYKNAENDAKVHGNNIYETGGSVTTLAIEILLRSGIEELELIGVDLAFVNGVTHASNTMDRKVRDVSKLEQIESVNGDLVYTDILMKSYLKWIENKIQEYPKVIIYNHSTSGARIKGTQRFI